jgi:hypothetical protein
MYSTPYSRYWMMAACSPSMSFLSSSATLSFIFAPHSTNEIRIFIEYLMSPIQFCRTITFVWSSTVT